MNLSARRQASTEAVATEKDERQAAQEAMISLNLGQGIDTDDNLYRRLTTGTKLHTRDLTPLSHDRQLEVAWWLFEQNPFAHRLITLMTDLIVGDGVMVEVLADDPRIQEVVHRFFTRNQLGQYIRSFYMSNALNGELVMPVAVNPVSGIPVLGFLDSAQVKQVVPIPDNILILDKLVLKGTTAGEGQTLNIIRENPVTGKLEGDVFYHRINALPNSLRGRSDLMPLADWLDLYDQFMFAEVERLNLLSCFAWDYEITGANSDAEVQAKVRKMPKLKPGQVFGHNEKEKLTPVAPDLKATDRSEVARMLRVHIAGSMGFPVSYLGDIDSNRATIEGQNDVMLKTPAARQKEFGGFLDLMVRFVIEQTTGKNPVLFRDAKPTYRITMPEIQAKDVARVGTVLASVATAMDTALSNRTTSRKLAVRVITTLVKQLGIDADPAAIAAEIEEDEQERQDTQDLLQQDLARRGLANPNQPVPDDPAEDDD
jgi:hypothetical protein